MPLKITDKVYHIFSFRTAPCCLKKATWGGFYFMLFSDPYRYHLLKNRPQFYQHGDYHIGNMMFNTYGNRQIIDFNRNDYGDPWEEFNRIVWCAQKSPLFASGMADGYFDCTVPINFWKLLAL